MEYDPIDITKFPPNLKDSLASINKSNVPNVSEHDVYCKIAAAKKPNSSVPGDWPKKVVQEFSCELALPVTLIFNSILRTLEYPRQWVIEYQIPLPKTNPPESVEDLRNIAKTSFFSKVFESYLSDWLMPIVRPYLDPNQFGLKGGSINHYLILLLRFIHQNLDLKDPHAVAVALIDLSKAFNRVSHQLVIEDLYDMHVPPWLLQILISYLTNRSMVLSYNGATSSPRSLPGSSPQGTFLGIFLFIVKFNGAALRPPIPRLPVNSCHAVYIDDLSEAASVNLRKLEFLPDSRPRPLRECERTEHFLPTDNVLQSQLENIKIFTDQNQMVLNERKSKVMLFNKSKNFIFPPEFSFSNGGAILECVEETLLLGVKINTNLKWASNTRYIVKKAMQKMWLLRRLKSLKIDNNIIFDYYVKEIRPIVEFGAVVWHSGLTEAESRDLERIQKLGLKIILAGSYQSYTHALSTFNIQSLEERRLILCTNFAVKLYCSDRRRQFFDEARTDPRTRSKTPLVKEQFSRTKRCQLAPHNFLARLVNDNQDMIEKRFK